MSSESPASQLSTAIAHSGSSATVSGEAGVDAGAARGRPIEGEQRRLTRGESHVTSGAPAVLPDSGVRADGPGPAVDPVHGSDAGKGHLDLDRLSRLVEEVVQVQVQQVTVLAQVAQDAAVLAR